MSTSSVLTQNGHVLTLVFCRIMGHIAAMPDQIRHLGQTRGRTQAKGSASDPSSDPASEKERERELQRELQSVPASLPLGNDFARAPQAVATSVSALNFGCRLNALESEVMQSRAQEAGLSNALLVNSCAVTGEAVRQVKQAIRKAHRDVPDRPIVVSGCAAQIEPESFARLPGVRAVLGNTEKLNVDAYRSVGQSDTVPDAGVLRRVSDIMTAQTLEAPDVAVRGRAGQDSPEKDGQQKHNQAKPSDGAGRARARSIVQIQNGCDHRCTFCIIPFGRGPSRSLAPQAVVEEVARRVDQGYLEVVLTGVDLTSYRARVGDGDLDDLSLGQLVRKILREVPDLKRLRLSSIDSIEADDALFAAIAEEERLMPHLHLSLQAGDDLTLKRMKRRHLSADAEAFCAKVRDLRPDIVFGADLIAGFPTETDDMFRSTLDHVDACGLTYLHIFPFSPRSGTPAARMPQVDRALIKERAARLRQKAENRLTQFLTGEVGQERAILMERDGFGRTPHFATVHVAGARKNQIVTARISSHTGKDLLGHCIGAETAITRSAGVTS